MQLLDTKKITQKINRIAIEILENNYREKEIILAGINNNGVRFANLLADVLTQKTTAQIIRTTIRLNPANPLETPVTIDMPLKSLKNKAIIIVDDVANTGRTIFYAFQPLMEVMPKKVEVAVLVDRKHKSFPIQVDYMGLSLATTLNEHIEVDLTNRMASSVRLE